MALSGTDINMRAIDCWVMAILIYLTFLFAEVTCQLPQVTGTTYPDAKRDQFSPRETVSVKCDRGHWFSYDDQQTQKTITCAESGQWDTAAICQGRQHYFHASISCGCINVLRIVVLISEPTRSPRSFRFDWIGVFF